MERRGLPVRMLAAALLIGAGLIVVGSLPVLATHQAAALLNSGFEDATVAPWSTSAGSLVRSMLRVRSGSAAGQLTTGSGATLVSQHLDVSAGEAYTASIWVWLEPDVDSARLELRWRRWDGSQFLDVGTTTSATVTTSGSWQQLSVADIAPATTTNLQLVIRLVPALPAQTAYLDDATLTGPAPHPTATPTAVPTATATPTVVTPGPGTPTPIPTPTPLPDGACLQINEVSVVAAEWVELINVCSRSVSTAGWVIRDNLGQTALPVTTLAPGQLTVVPGPIGNGLADSADMLVLIPPAGGRGSSVNWGPPSQGWANWFSGLFDPGLTPPRENRSLARQPQRYWHGAADWNADQAPTPGMENAALMRMPVAMRARTAW